MPASTLLAVTLHNIPEGAAVALPLRNDGFSNGKAFLYGAGSGLVEPIGGILAVLVAGHHPADALVFVLCRRGYDVCCGG